MGNHMVVAADAATKSSSSSFLPLLIIVVLFGLFYMTIIRPQRNRQRQRARSPPDVANPLYDHRVSSPSATSRQNRNRL